MPAAASGLRCGFCGAAAGCGMVGLVINNGRGAGRSICDFFVSLSLYSTRDPGARCFATRAAGWLAVGKPEVRDATSSATAMDSLALAELLRGECSAEGKRENPERGKTPPLATVEPS